MKIWIQCSSFKHLLQKEKIHVLNCSATKLHDPRTLLPPSLRRAKGFLSFIVIVLTIAPKLYRAAKTFCFFTEFSAFWVLSCLRTADAFPVVPSLPPKIATLFFGGREVTTGNASAVRIFLTFSTSTVLVDWSGNDRAGKLSRQRTRTSVLNSELSENDLLKWRPFYISEIPVCLKCSNISWSFAHFQGLIPVSLFATFWISSTELWS